jgi:quercetin dioxygenase-like cupin family protein
VQHWNLNEIETPDGSRSPAVLHSQDGESRVVLIELSPGQSLSEHQVTEAALLLVVSGRIRIESGDEAMDAGAGELFRFDPAERRSVLSPEGGRVLLTLSPWPGEGHYRGEEAVSASA